ncbi:MAG: hypothetical protein M1815_003492 [Lichina confinis]|nr:MAG: hypothetical protein M1815_003492 [Lichina confinis]
MPECSCNQSVDLAVQQQPVHPSRTLFLRRSLMRPRGTRGSGSGYQEPLTPLGPLVQTPISVAARGQNDDRRHAKNYLIRWTKQFHVDTIHDRLRIAESCAGVKTANARWIATSGVRAGGDAAVSRCGRSRAGFVFRVQARD